METLLKAEGTSLIDFKILFVYFGGDMFLKNSTTYPIFKYYKNISRDPPFSLIFLDDPPFKAIFFYVIPPQIPPAPPPTS